MRMNQRIKLYGCTAGTPLFDTIEDDMDIVPFTPELKSVSLESNELVPIITKETQMEKIYEAVKLGMRVNDRQIHVITGIDRHLIPDRRGKLLKQKRIRYAGKYIDPVTHKRTAAWEINN